MARRIRELTLLSLTLAVADVAYSGELVAPRIVHFQLDLFPGFYLGYLGNLSIGASYDLQAMFFERAEYIQYGS